MKDTLHKDDEIFKELVSQAFSKDSSESFEGSIKLSQYVGVPENEILKSQEDIDRLFLGE